MEKRQMHTPFTTFSRRFGSLAPILILGLLLSGCGNKTLPKPISKEAPPQLTNLNTRVEARGVELSWSMSNIPEAGSNVLPLRLSVRRAELGWESRGCLDCPAPNQQEILSIDPLHPEPALFQDHNLLWVDGNVSFHHAYRYQLVLLDKNSAVIAESNPSIAKVVPPPALPTNLHAATEPQGIILHWRAPTKDVQGRPLQGELQFLIERLAPGGTWEKISPVPIKGLTFMDPAVAAAQTYDYRVIPMLLFEGTPVIGAPALIRQVKAPNALPPPPPKTVWVVPSEGALEVHWTESEGKVAGYHVYRREGKEITRLTANPIQHPPYLDRAIKKNVIYYYAVSAVSAKADHREGLLSKWVEIKSLSLE